MNLLYGLDFDEMLRAFNSIGLSKLDVKRVFPWIYKKRILSFDEMTDISLATRKVLSEHFSLDLPVCKLLQTSQDGTEKALLALTGNEEVETVLIKDADRRSICISTQLGCPMKCEFCNTGTQKYVRNLTTAEITGQYLFWEDRLRRSGEKVTHIIVMGMGEPLLNYSNLSSWLSIMLDERGVGISRHRITVSTVGITDNLEDMARKYRVQLAISLHAPNDEIRSQIMPANKKYNIDNILEIARKYPSLSNTDYVTFEYLMLGGINDSLDCAKELTSLLSGIACKVNLIMFNEWQGNSFKRSSSEAVRRFQELLKKRGVMCTLRKSKGNDILAACGQLKSERISETVA